MLGVHPVYAAAGVVNGEAIGPEQVCVCDDPAVRAVHVRVLDAWRVPPVRPVNLTEGKNGTFVVSFVLVQLKLAYNRLLSGFQTQQMS